MMTTWYTQGEEVSVSGLQSSFNRDRAVRSTWLSRTAGPITLLAISLCTT